MSEPWHPSEIKALKHVCALIVKRAPHQFENTKRALRRAKSGGDVYVPLEIAVDGFAHSISHAPKNSGVSVEKAVVGEMLIFAHELSPRFKGVPTFPKTRPAKFTDSVTMEGPPRELNSDTIRLIVQRHEYFSGRGWTESAEEIAGAIGVDRATMFRYMAVGFPPRGNRRVKQELEKLAAGVDQGFTPTPDAEK